MFVRAVNTGKGFITHEDHTNGLSFKSLGGDIWKVEGPFTELNAWVTRVGGTEVPAATMEPTAKALKENEIYAKAKERMDLAVSQYSYGETSTWRDLEREAKQYQIDSTVGELMQFEIDNNGRDAATIAATVIAKANILHAFRADVIVNRVSHINAMKALTDAEQILAYDLSAGWPTLS